ETAGVPEYWIIDNRPGRQRAHFYQLGPNGEYHSVPIGADGVYHSAVLPGFRLRVEWFWQGEPGTLRALAEVVGPENIAAALRRVTGAEAHA
ncbi:MAG TPA: Uma2 family endonuclease, partial [Ardenticatenaceae bacterium]|nr:Uma2 family endonuclease [Ardenticatenaceae bacterium]